MEESISVEEEKLERHGSVLIWETAKYIKIWYDEDVLDLRSVETEFPAIVFNDSLTSNETPSYEPMVSFLNNNEIDFRISFDESDDEDYMGSFIMGLNVNIVAWNHFVNGMLFNLIKNLYVPFGIPFDPKRYYKDGDCARMLRMPRAIRHMALPPRDQRHQYLRFEGLQYTEGDIADFEMRLARIYRREVHRVQVFDFGGLPDLIAEGLSTRMLMEHIDAQGLGVFSSRTWRQLFDIRGPLVCELILEFFSTFRFGEAVLDLDIVGAPHFFIAGRSQAPEKVTVTDLFYLRGLDVGSVNIPYLLARYLRRFAAWRKSGALILASQDDGQGGVFLLAYIEICRVFDEYRGRYRSRTMVPNTSTAPQQPDP
ncbi:hypothetical protein Tco_0694023 [Tanacetum coccineum]